EPAAVPLSVGPDGAPVVPGRHVSIAHTGRGSGTVAVAAVSAGPVGVDLERVGPRRADLWRRVLSPSEHGVLDAFGGPTDSTQTLLWALKEAVLKGQRTGLRAGARSVTLGVPDGTGPHRGRLRAVSEQSGAWEVAYALHGEAWVVAAWAVDR
ncbi:MAG TPA: 4'-phosphopantetheinyl transferase superfamily protein, partial [Rubricoccaceae bacterium]